MKLMRNATLVLATLLLLTTLACPNPAGKTDVPDTTPPAEVSGLMAAAGDAQVALSWTAPADADFTGVLISYAGLASPLAVPKGSSSYTFTGLDNGVAYDFTVRTVDSAGNASKGVSESATPAAGIPSDTTAPAEVSGLIALPGDAQVALSWTAPADADFAGVSISYAGLATPIAVDKASSSYTFTGLTNDVAYAFTVKTVDLSGNASAGVPAVATPLASIPPDTTPPAEVTGLMAVGGESQVVLTWTAPTDPDFASVSIGYAGLATPVTVVKGTSTYTFTGLADGTAYAFTVKTVDASGNASTGVGASGTPVDLTPPANPVLGAPLAFNASVTLAWTEPGDADFAGVQITYPGLASPIAVAKGTIRHTITGLTNAVEVSFTVKAADTAGNLSSGAEVKATPDATKIGIGLQ